MEFKIRGGFDTKNRQSQNRPLILSPDFIPVSITEETANGVKYTHNVYESNYDAVTGKTTEKESVVGGKTIGTLSVSDWFGRNEAVTVMTKDPFDETVTDYGTVSSQYGYVTENGITTNLISSVNNTVTGSDKTNTVNYNYTYDTNGKITGITAVSNITGLSSASQYVYDEAGQLIKEITGADYTEYAYDSKGNISTRKVYSNNTLVSTDNYTYGSETWEDRLTGYNNKTITYDGIGNPTSYLGATLTWRGRELESYTKGNIQISYSYDVDGMRYQKVVKTDGVETSRYDYVYSEGTLVLVTYTADDVTDTARFIYDSYGEPRGFILNDTAAYLYIKNAQGDITGIVNENGEVILTCSYDAWGRVNFGSTNMAHMTLAAKLSQINPFTYRGYCYDYDIGMYYLQSRYYDPEIGRFINADSTDYLGATGTLLSYNLFAYCENDGVNGVDPEGCAPAKEKIVKAINRILECATSFSKFLLDKFRLSRKRYMKITKFKTPKSISVFVYNNKKTLKNFKNKGSDIARFVNIVLDIIDLSTVIKSDTSCTRAVAEIIFFGFIKLLTYAIPKLVTWLVTTIFKVLKFAKSLIENILTYILEDLIERSNYTSLVKNNYLNYVDEQTELSFKVFIYGLFQGVKKCFV